MSESLIAQVKRLVEAQKGCWAFKWPLERLSDTSLGADTRHMVQVGVTDDGEPIGEVDGGLEPVADGHKDVLDLLVASLGFDFPALLEHLERTQAVVDAAREALPNIPEWEPDLDEMCCDIGTGSCSHCGAFYVEGAGRGRANKPKVHKDNCPYARLNAALAEINALAKGSQ